MSLTLAGRFLSTRPPGKSNKVDLTKKSTFDRAFEYLNSYILKAKNILKNSKKKIKKIVDNLCYVWYYYKALSKQLAKRCFVDIFLDSSKVEHSAVNR